MDCVQMARAVRTIVEETAGENRVVPGWPRGRWTPAQKGRPETVTGGVRRGEAAGWSVLIEYIDSGGDQSHRRISIVREEARCGGHQALAAFCHEAGEYRVFRLDRIVAMAAIDTGELLDPRQHVDQLRREGLPFTNRGMATFAKLLVFFSRCDGQDHPAEWATIEEQLGRYALRYGGDDADIEDAICRCRRLAPDARDFSNALCAIVKTPADYRRSVSKLAIEACGAVIDADNRQTPEELAWGVSVGRALKLLAGTA